MFEILSVCKGGGYRYCRTNPPHPNANRMGLYPLHRVVAENKIGRLLRADEDVHHVDGDKTNDVPDNLEVLSKAEHARRHNVEVAPLSLICRCGRTFSIKAHTERARRDRNKTREVFCSRRCGGKYGHSIAA